MPPLRTTRAILTIPNGAAVSNPFQLGEYNTYLLTTPAAWTAAVLTFDVSVDGVTWVPLFDDAGAEVSIANATIVAAHALVDAGILRKTFGATWIRLRSGAAGAPVVQGADRAFNIIAKAL